MRIQTDSDAPSSRLLKSASLLRTYFERKLKTQLELLTQAPSEPLGEGMQFDLQLSQYGIWGLRSQIALSEKSQTEIAATFHGLLGAMGNLENKNRSLRDLELRLNAAFTEAPSNVISITRAMSKSSTTLRAVGHSAGTRRWLLRLDCLIESERAEDIHKMALELHSHSSRFAFIEYQSLATEARQNLSELLSLGTVSLFVRNILELTHAEQTVLADLCRHNSMVRPLLMIGAPIPYSDLRGDPEINVEFLALLSRAYIKLTRAFKEYKDQGLIHYFLDSLSQYPT